MFLSFGAVEKNHTVEAIAVTPNFAGLVGHCMVDRPMIKAAYIFVVTSKNKHAS